jgi:CHAT domain-containing protein
MAGLEEPALVLTPLVKEKKPEDGKDGLLTAQEITALTLRADWVILVACNSASADGTPNGEALSGLADAFLAAGARGVVVSHWEVNPTISVGLLIRLFQAWDGGKLRMEDALMVAMQAQRNGLILPGWAFRTKYSWAPFEVVSR